MYKTTSKNPNSETITVVTIMFLIPTTKSPFAALNTAPSSVEDKTGARVFTKLTNEVPFAIWSLLNVSCAAGTVETALNDSDTPVIVNAMKNIIIGVDGLMKINGTNATTSAPVAIAIASHEFERFFAIHVPAIVGRISVKIVRGIVNVLATVAFTPTISIAANVP